MARRTQAERSGATTSQLVDAAAELFGSHGFAGAPLDAVAARAGVTKGAAYHHFPGGKTALFHAVFVRHQAALAEALFRAGAAAPDPRAALRAGARTFLEHCLDPGFQRVVLLDGPSVLGWETVREIEYEHALRVLREAMEHAVREAGGTPDAALTARCQLVFGALCEGGMLLARATDPETMLEVVTGEALKLLGEETPPDA
ncbi:TetR/AcrR family transcriptional regulator [Streptomyces sp. NPDC060205]|uniref:TetR/AcrR family transcriptional regulator n=1 Tax=Streptomyces sp. NPDC060205 TaxID=3347072 RepID=UPI003651C3FE